MYKLLLCLRYLRTRFIALASIISVMLGVATMIVVNSVMSGFTAEMHNRLKGIYSDVTIRSRCVNGFPDATWHMNRIRQIAGDSIEVMTPTVEVPAMLDIRCGNQWISQPVLLMGIDEKTQGLVSDFGKYLQHPENRDPTRMNFELRDGGYLVRDPSAGPDVPDRVQMAMAGWPHRREKAELDALLAPARSEARHVQPSPPLRGQPLGKGPADEPIDLPPAGPPSASAAAPPIDLTLPSVSLPSPEGAPTHGSQMNVRDPSRGDPSAGGEDRRGQRDKAAAGKSHDPFGATAPIEMFNPAKQTHTGVILGIALCSRRDRDGKDVFYAVPGDDVILSYPKNLGNGPPQVTSNNYTVADLWESKMSENDEKYVFVPIEQLQRDRGMIDPQSGVRYVNTIQIKLKPDADGAEVRDRLAMAFEQNPKMRGMYVVQTWKDQQGPLLAAVQMETAILNVLLFLIIAVAGFGILAIFLMIVVEKTRDIGVLKSLGASRRGIMGIFLGYGLSLGLVGSLAGMVLGLWFVKDINWLAKILGDVTGRPVFDPSIYYFYKIPTLVEPWTVASIVLGALGIAVAASVLPALRAAWLHPVEALRHE